MTPAFWDTSALVPLCVQQQPSAAVRQMLQRYQIAVWWATPVEMRSAFERLLRMGQLTGANTLRLECGLTSSAGVGVNCKPANLYEPRPRPF
jgi:predicted nucleic acid-binding protein